MEKQNSFKAPKMEKQSSFKAPKMEKLQSFHGITIERQPSAMKAMEKQKSFHSVTFEKQPATRGAMEKQNLSIEKQPNTRGVMEKQKSFRGFLEKQKSFRVVMERQLSFMGGGERKKNKDSPGKRGDLQLHLAARAGNFSRVKEILQNCDGSDPKELLSKQNQEGNPTLWARNGYDPFHVAAKQGHLDVLKELLSVFPNLVMTTDLSCTTALHTAAAQGHIDVVDFLLETDSNLAKIARNNGKTALHSAARMGHVEVVKSLVSKDPSTGFRVDKKGQAAIHMAVKGQNEEIVLELVKPDPIVRCLLSVEGIDVNALNKAGESPLDIAEKLGNQELVAVLKEAGAIHSKDHGKPQNPAKQLKQTVSDIKHDVQSQLQQTRQTRFKVKKIAKNLKKLHISGLNNAINSATVVAVLIATVAFAAIFTVPGQYVEEKTEGHSLGEAHIASNAAFIIFIVFDSLALFISLAVVVVQTSVVVIEEKAKTQLVFVINKLMWSACLFISVAFISLTYVVVGKHSRWLAVFATVIGSTIMLTTIGSMCYCVVMHRMEEKKLRNIRRERSRSHSFSVSVASDQEILNTEYKRMRMVLMWFRLSFITGYVLSDGSFCKRATTVMGVIKNGTVSGNLPSNETFAVHHPGYPSSTSRAIQTLGGTESILKARSLKSNKLELHFRPEDPYSRPTFGALNPCNSFLLKISKIKSCDGQSAGPSSKMLEHSLPEATKDENSQVGQPESEPVAAGKEVDVQVKEEDGVNLSADIVASVSEAYFFDGMADYQHVVAIHADVAWRKKRNWTEMEEQHCEKDAFMNLDEDDVMMMLPPFFAPKDMPTNLVLRPSALPSSKKKEEEVVQNPREMDITSGGLQQFYDYLTFHIPEKVNWGEIISRDSEQWKWQMAVSKLFDERPIWPKASLIERLLDEGLKFNRLMLKRLLLGNAYYFSNGPFLRFWIRKGYDPRKDPESRIYQRIDYRVKPQVRSYCESNAGAKLKNRWKDLCAFKVFPTKCSTSLQLFELADDYIQQEIRKPTKETTCSLETGWFSRHVLALIRKRVEVRFLSVYPEPGAGNLLKTASDRFAKLKKISFLNHTLKPDQKGHQQLNMCFSPSRIHCFSMEILVPCLRFAKSFKIGPDSPAILHFSINDCSSDKDKEKCEILGDENEDRIEEVEDEDRIEEDEEEEDRIEVDNSEDESDAEALDLVNEEEEIPFQSHSCILE
ncbi:hypothetical protein Pint_26376 [Pistacia integerrima]|uniref:Uncharacterized protein n=1 Tax=Pistacia integerrima TaxID=434235 RepID=A0ACC0YB34_9ROSI|nr:hypothetical protein Pint_26376 [Pistacia integerrima]